MTRDSLDPIADSVVRVYAAYGRSVLVAGAVEKVLLVDLVRRHVDVDGITVEIGESINDLERRSAGTIAGRLRRMGIDGDLATRIGRFVEQRNQIVHHWAETAHAIAALVGADTKPAIDQLDAFALECEQLVNLIGPEAFERASAAFDAKPEQIVGFILDLDVDDVEDPDLARELGVMQERLAVFDAAALPADAAPGGEDADPGEPADGVYALYGRVMMAVQYWELALAMTWCQRTTPPNANRSAADSRASKKAVTRLERAFTKVTAGQALPELRDELPADLHESQTRLQDDRNRLAHRFLREAQLRDAFRPGTLAELADAGERFDRAVHDLLAEMAKTPAHAGEVPAHWPQMGDELASALFAGETIDFEALLARFSPAPPAAAKVDRDDNARSTG